MGCTTMISIVNTNAVVLCEYLPQEFPLWRLLKVIVLHCCTGTRAFAVGATTL